MVALLFLLPLMATGAKKHPECFRFITGSFLV